MSDTKKPLWIGAIPTTTTQYVQVPVVKGAIGCHVAWTDAISAAAITLELSSFPSGNPVATAAWQANGTEAAGYKWADSGETFTGPAASAAGSLVINIENCRQSRARLKIVTTAASDFIIYNGEHP